MTNQQSEMIKRLCEKYKISKENLDMTLIFLGVGYGLSEEQIEQYLALKNTTLLEKHNLMMSLVQGTEKSDVDIDADRDVDVKSKKLFCCPLFKKRKEKGLKTKGKESYKELADYIMESEYLSAAQIEQLRLAAKAGMPQEDILRLAKKGKEPMEIRKCVEFYEMTKNR